MRRSRLAPPLRRPQFRRLAVSYLINEAIAKRGTAIADETIYRCLSDISRRSPYRLGDGTVAGISNRTSYLMNSQLSHKTRRYGRWTLPRLQYEIGLSNFVAISAAATAAMRAVALPSTPTTISFTLPPSGSATW